MAVDLKGKLVVAISSRALFDFEEANSVYENVSADEYRKYQRERLDHPAALGAAFPLVRKLLSFNCSEIQRVEVVILSRNDPVSGLRVFKSAIKNDLNIERGMFTQGREPFYYLQALQADLFLSANEQDVREAIGKGFPAARVYPNSLQVAQRHQNEIRIAFDGDAVLFSDESEKVFQARGLDAFQAHEKANSLNPLSDGPMKSFLNQLNKLRESSSELDFYVRTALVTARSAPAHERAIRTLMSWGIEVDEAMFLGGLDKAPFLKEFEPDFFFDDQIDHCESAVRVTPTGHVLGGLKNDDTSKNLLSKLTA